jgi:hypothetical protein
MSGSADTGRSLARSARSLLAESAATSWTLFTAMVPVIIAVKVLQEAGAVAPLAGLLAPVMRLVGLPGQTGIIWGTTMLVNLYAGMGAFASLAPALDLSAAQATVLTTMMLVAHSLPVELRITGKAGVRVRAMAPLRVVGALVLGRLLASGYGAAGLLRGAARTVLSAPAGDPSLAEWATGQLRNLLLIFLIIVGLLLLMRALGRLGVTDALTSLLERPLRTLGVGAQAAPITVIGMLLGLTYGGGLIIAEARSGRVSARDVFLGLALMSLCHSLVEDTFLMVALGGHLSGVLVARLAFSLVVVALMGRLLLRVPEAAFRRWLMKAESVGRAPPTGPVM